jgi:hypothetical protein
MADERETLEALVLQLQHLLAEFQKATAEIRDERKALITIVVKHGNLPLLHEVADLLERQSNCAALKH